MKAYHQTWEKDGYLLRPARAEDAEAYFSQNFDPLDPEVARCTGCKAAFSREEVVGFFRRCLEDGNRYDFLLLAPDGRIIGESVLNEINWDVRCANFRICIFHPADRGRGLGAWMIAETRDFAFEKLRFHRLELDVFSFNTRAERAYQAAGFQREGILRDAVWSGGKYADDILMAILEDDWKKLKAGE